MNILFFIRHFVRFSGNKYRERINTQYRPTLSVNFEAISRHPCFKVTRKNPDVTVIIEKGR